MAHQRRAFPKTAPPNGGWPVPGITGTVHPFAVIMCERKGTVQGGSNGDTVNPRGRSAMSTGLFLFLCGRVRNRKAPDAINVLLSAQLATALQRMQMRQRLA